MTGNVTLGVVTADSIDNTPIGNTTRSSGKFTSVYSNDVADKQVVFGSTDKLIGATGFTYNSGTNTLTAANISSSGTASLTTVKVGDLTSGRVPFAGADGVLLDDYGLAFDVSTHKLTVNQTNVTGLATFGDVVTLTAGAAISLGTYNTGTLQVTGDVSVDGYMQIKQDLRVAGAIYKNGYEVINTQDTIDGGTF